MLILFDNYTPAMAQHLLLSNPSVKRSWLHLLDPIQQDALDKAQWVGQPSTTTSFADDQTFVRPHIGFSNIRAQQPVFFVRIIVYHCSFNPRSNIDTSLCWTPTNMVFLPFLKTPGMVKLLPCCECWSDIIFNLEHYISAVTPRCLERFKYLGNRAWAEKLQY